MTWALFFLAVGSMLVLSNVLISHIVFLISGFAFFVFGSWIWLEGVRFYRIEAIVYVLKSIFGKLGKVERSLRPEKGNLLLMIVII